ncbi:type II secretion system protein N [Acinetobacter sp. YH12239]|uniref:type II secretion system protein N n=1 Tax=Acinetobacter sp. YH12239 TaxID=2601166 RepID=UPI0015D463E0|nr:type II secretion system protein N [Acinetobacter sp. YH12239]
MKGFQDKFSQISFKDLDRIAPLTLFILILIMMWKLASLFWLVVAPPQVMQVEQVALGSQQPPVPNISSFSLFQETGAQVSGADANLALTLQGVVVSTPSSQSSAVIKVREVADRYTIGQTLEGSSYQLSEVYWDHVVLKQPSGATTELRFTGIENLNQPLIPDAQQNSANATSNSGQTTTQNAIGQAINQIQENREQYLSNMGVNTDGGQGYEVTDRTPAFLRSKLGLRPGDRVLSLNGQSVGQGQSDAQLLEQARREGKVRIEVKRGDQVMTFQQEF